MFFIKTYQEVLWSRVLVNKIRVKYVEFVALHNLGWRVVHVVVSLVVFVPLKASVDSKT